MVLRVCICGGGNGAHVLAGTASTQPDVDARVLTLYADEAQRWTDKMAANGLNIKLHHQGALTEVLNAKPFMVTRDVAKAICDVDVIVFVVPAFAHVQYLTAIKPHIKPGMILVGLPGACGFEFTVRFHWKDLAKQVTLMSFESLPWACRILDFGCRAEVLGIKEAIMGALHLGDVQPTGDATEMVQSIMGPLPRLTTTGHLLGMTMMATNSYLHPCLMYDLWHKWDGKPLESKPLFYQGVSQAGADLLAAVSQEVMDIAKSIMEQRSKIDLSNVDSIHNWLKRCYPEDIEDKSTLYTSLRTNAAYKGLTHPMKATDDSMYLPDYSFRYLVEDIPFGLLVIRSVATIAGVATPNMDRVVEWAQGVLGKEYLVDGKVIGKDLKGTRCPQAYGMNTLDSILGIF